MSKTFIRSLGYPSKVGDLLIIGLDTHFGESTECLDDRMLKQYQSKELDSLLAPLHGLPMRKGDGDSEHVVEVTVEEGSYTNVPNSQTVVFSAPMETGE